MAMDLINDIIPVQETMLGKEHLDTLNTKKHFASVNFSVGEYTEALNIIREVLEAEEKGLDPIHPVIFVTKHELARAYNHQRDNPEALKIIREVLEAKERSFRFLASFYPCLQTQSGLCLK
jgi:tetratricopeptide (TPR) repeat protein